MQLRPSPVERLGGCIDCEEMSTPRSPQKPDGKPTEPANHDEDDGQRERTKSGDDRGEPSRSGDDRGKPSIEPGKHDANVGQRGTLDDDHEVE